MRKLTVMKILRLAGVMFGVSLVLSGCGELGVQQGIRAEVTMTVGDKLRLYYGGPQEAREMFCIGETVSVYRAYPQERLRYVEVGKVRILKAVDKNHLEAEVVEGKVKEGDLARKSIAACKVLPPMQTEK